jgi:putative ABC transport system ATP-binding protein
MTAALLAAHDIRLSYGRGTARFDALKGVSLEIAAGESVAIPEAAGGHRPCARRQPEADLRR